MTPCGRQRLCEATWARSELLQLVLKTLHELLGSRLGFEHNVRILTVCLGDAEGKLSISVSHDGSFLSYYRPCKRREEKL